MTEDPTAEPKGQMNGLRVGLFCLLLVFLNAQGDGFRLGAGATQRQLLLLPFTCFFCGVLVCLLFPRLGARQAPASLAALFSGWRASVIVAMGGALLCAVLFSIEAHYYADKGYRLHPAATGLVFGCALAGLALQLPRRWPSSANRLFAVVLLVYGEANVVSH